jgi:acyl carrier protein
MNIKETLRQFIATELATEGSRGPIADNDLLIEQGIIDSFGIMSLLGFLEEKFAVRIEGDELMPENFASIGAISDLIGRKNGVGLGA